MANILLAFDDRDVVLGDFFDKCAKDSIQALNQHEISTITSQSLNSFFVEMKTNELNGKPFLFAIYSHGSDKELLANGDTPFISINLNEQCTKNGFVYTFACSAGKELGKTLVDNGALAFVGYNKTVTVQKFFFAFDSFCECAIHGLVKFNSGIQLDVAFNDMKNKYTDCIDRFYAKNMLIASHFMENRDALVLIGQEQLTIKDLIVN